MENYNSEALKSNEILNRVKLILSMKSEERTDDHIFYVYDYFTKIKCFVFFNKLDHQYGFETIKKFIRYMNFKSFRKNEILIRQGKEADSCFFIIKGTVEVTITNFSIENNIKKVEEIKIINISEGKLVGEKSIIDKRFRSATVQCKTECYLGEISKENYLLLFEKFQKLEMNKEINFYRIVSQFRNYSRATLEKLFYIFEHKKLKWHEILIEQNKPIDCIYIIKKGKFLVTYKNVVKIINNNNFNFLNYVKNLQNCHLTENNKSDFIGSHQKLEIYKVRYFY